MKRKANKGLRLRRDVKHICWDGCGFPPEIMLNPATWNAVLKEMVLVRRGLIERGVKGAAELKLHMSLWPFIFQAQAIDLDTCLDLIMAAEFEGERFDGVDIFIDDAHLALDADYEAIAAFAEKIKSRGLVVGDIVAPAWGFKKGGPAMTKDGSPKFLQAFEATCPIAQVLEQLGVRPYGRIRLDTASDVPEFLAGKREALFQNILGTFRKAAGIARTYGQKIAVEAEVCWAGIHGWRWVKRLFDELTPYHDVIGFQTDEAHTLHLVAGVNCPKKDNLLPLGKRAANATPEELQAGIERMARRIGKHTASAHIAASNGLLKAINTGSKAEGTKEHAKTGAHIPADDPTNIVCFLDHIIPWITEEDDAEVAA